MNVQQRSEIRPVLKELFACHQTIRNEGNKNIVISSSVSLMFTATNIDVQ